MQKKVAFLLFPPIFLACAGFEALFGVDDFLHARDVTQLIIGLLWSAAAVNSVAAAFLVVWDRPAAIASSLAAGLSGVLGAAYVLWVDARSPEEEPWRWMVWVLVALSAYTIVQLGIFLTLTPIASWKLIVATILPLASVIQFWYQTQYLPATLRPQINLTSSIEESGRSPSGAVTLRATISAENPGGSRVQVLGSIYRVYGFRSAGLRDDDARLAPPPDEVSRSFEWVKNEWRYEMDRSKPDSGLLQADEVLPILAFFEPKQAWSTTFVFDVDSSVHPFVRLEAELHVARAANLDLAVPTSCPSGATRSGLRNVEGPQDVITTEAANFVCVAQAIEPPNAVHKYVGDEPSILRELILSEKSRLNRYYPQIRVFYVTPQSLEERLEGFQAAQLRINVRYPGIVTWTATEIGTAFKSP